MTFDNLQKTTNKTSFPFNYLLGKCPSDVGPFVNLWADAPSLRISL